MAQENINLTPRLQPVFTRKPSKRYQRRSDPPDGADGKLLVRFTYKFARSLLSMKILKFAAPDATVIISRDEYKNNVMDTGNYDGYVVWHRVGRRKKEDL